jgi:hypothetical protein
MEVKLPMSLQRKELHEFVGPEFALVGSQGRIESK